MSLVATRTATQQPGSANSSTTGAVVIGGDYQGLGIVRSLGRRGVPTCIVDDERSIARFSRYATHAVHVSNLRDEDRTVDSLLRIGRRLKLGGWVLYPTRDETVAAISRHRAALAEWFLVPTPRWETIEWAWDKRKTYELAHRLGIPAPRTWQPSDHSELAQIEADPPFVIKPAIKEHFIYATKAKAWRANTRKELSTLFEQAVALVGPGEAMVQELIPGAGEHQVAYCAFARDGRPVASMTVRRRRQHPPEFGRASTFVETIDLPEIARPAKRFLQAIDYYGLVELEFKLDPRDGHYKLLDVNARTWGYHSLGHRAGIDFPYLLYADQVGLSVEPGHARSGVGWVRLVTDLPTAALELLRGRLNWREYLDSLGRCREEAVFALEDPLPGLLELALIPYLSMKRGF